LGRGGVEAEVEIEVLPPVGEAVEVGVEPERLMELIPLFQRT
jgi:hypothetical protein